MRQYFTMFSINANTTRFLYIWLIINGTSLTSPFVFSLPPAIHIGAIFCQECENSPTELAFKYAVHSINRDKSILPDTKLLYDIQYVDRQDLFQASKKVCAQIQNGIQAIFGPSSLSTALSAQFLSTHIHSICDALDIPHLEMRIIDRMLTTTTSAAMHYDLPSQIWHGVNYGPEFAINLHPSQFYINIAFYDVINFLNWTKAALLFEESCGIIRIRELMKLAPNLELLVRPVHPKTYLDTLLKLKYEEVHNIIIDTNAANVATLIKNVCEKQIVFNERSEMVKGEN